MSRIVLLAFALACAPHDSPQQGEVLLVRPIALLPLDAACDGALARIADAAVVAGLGRDEQYFDSARLPPEKEVFATGPSRQALVDLVAGRPELAPPAGRRYGYEQDSAQGGAARWRIHCMHAEGLVLRALAGAVIVDDDYPSVRIDMLAADARAFHALTEAHLDRRIAVVDGDEVLMAPVVKTPIPGGSVRIDLGSDEREPRVAAARVLTRLLGR